MERPNTELEKSWKLVEDRLAAVLADHAAALAGAAPITVAVLTTRLANSEKRVAELEKTLEGFIEGHKQKMSDVRHHFGELKRRQDVLEELVAKSQAE